MKEQLIEQGETFKELEQQEQKEKLEIDPTSESLNNIELSKSEIINSLSKIEVSNIEQRESLDALEHELLRLTRELKESIEFHKTEEDKELYLFDIASKWAEFEDIKKEYFLLNQEKQDIEQRIEKLDNLKEFTKEAATEVKLEQEITNLQDQIEPQERIYSQVRGSDFIPEDIKNKALENLENIGQSIDELNLPSIEPSKDPKEIFQITKEGALLSEDMGNTYRLILKEAPKRWAEKTKKLIEKLKEKKITKKLAEFMEKIKLPERLSKGVALGAMILTGAYILGGCTKVGEARKETAAGTEKLTPEETTARETSASHVTIEETVYQGSIHGAKYEPGIGIVVENGNLKFKLVPLVNLDDGWTDQPVESVLFERIQNCENKLSDRVAEGFYSGRLVEHDVRQRFEQFRNEKPNTIAGSLDIKLDFNTTPEELIQIVAKTVTEELEYSEEDSVMKYERDFNDIFRTGKGVCEEYSVLTEYLANYLIKKYKMPNIIIENMKQDFETSEGKQDLHALNIVYVADKNGDVSATLIDPTYLETKGRFNALEMEHLRIFNQENIEDVLGIMEHLEKPETQGKDMVYIGSVVEVMLKMYREIELNNEPAIKSAERMINIFSNDYENKDNINIVFNFFRLAIQERIQKAETATADQSGQYYKLAQQIYELAEQEFPPEISRWDVCGMLQKLINKIPTEFRK